MEIKASDGGRPVIGSRKLTWAEIDTAVHQLDSLDVTDPEKAHSEADEIITGFLPPDIADAYMRLQERCPWWAAA